MPTIVQFIGVEKPIRVEEDYERVTYGHLAPDAEDRERELLDT